MKGQLASWLLLAIGASACSGGGGNDANTAGGERVTVAGILAHSPATLVRTSDSTLVGFPYGVDRLDIIDIATQQRASMNIPREACGEPNSILSLVPWDLNRDGRDDVLIQNSSCGPWIALADEHAGFALSPASELIPSPLRPDLETHVLRRRDGGELLVTLTNGVVNGLAREPGPSSDWIRHSWRYPEGTFVPTQTTAFILDQLRSSGG